MSNEKTFHHLALLALLNGPVQLGFQPLVHLVASLALNSVMRSGPFGGLSHTWKWEEEGQSGRRARERSGTQNTQPVAPN